MASIVKRLLNGAAEKTLPAPAYRQLLNTYLGLKTDLNERRNAWRLNRLRNAYQGRRAFIIGNGPSLTVADMRRLKDEVTIGCNGLFLMFEDIGYVATLFTVEDHLVAEDRAAEIGAIRGSTKVFPRDVADYYEQHDDITYVDFVRDYEPFPQFSADLTLNAFWGGTVTYLNIQLAYYVGCREIYLLGVDHNYQVPPAEEIGPKDLIASQSADVNHFDPRYFGPGYRWHHPRVERMELAYWGARDAAKQYGFSIYNATRGGKLE
ncbi:MAG: DUF115 domain-containing protein, partial [Chloroflexi bacterium]|nr:DUF115 domain-containing protein [Chloroflexota bacterium]